MNNLVMCTGVILAALAVFTLITGLPVDTTALWVLFLVGLSMAGGGLLSKELD